MKLVRTVADVRSALAPERSSRRIALVPTMGALHRGHVSLCHAARRAADIVVATIFVNPAQFNDPKDLVAYPRDEARDAELAAAAGVDLLFVPDATEMYPQGYATWIDVEGPALGFEGELRPGHFRGVATVCLKLFTIVGPTVAFFGQKDAQQVAVVRQLVRDLNVPVEIRVAPTVRDPDGLALSSRNARLSPAERQSALAIPRALGRGLAAYRRGRDPVAEARSALADFIPDYVALVPLDGHPTLVIAGRAGSTRLIDNLPLDAPDLGGFSETVPEPSTNGVRL